ncbi:MAG: hypothetical protein KGL39_36630, partial [Patescibacteria group bacterium]|nr:hypothetical protein [Patescibacteria group bacterium]
ETKFAIAELQAKTTINQTRMGLPKENPEALLQNDDLGNEVPNSALSALVDTMNRGLNEIIGESRNHHAEMMNVSAQNHAQLVNQMNKPKVVKRGPDGRVIGVA